MSDSVARRARRLAPVLGAALLFAPAAVLGQPAGAPAPAQQWDSPAPPRIANHWDSLAHQPTQADVGAAEQELGLSGSPEHDRAVDKELQDLSNQLLGAEQGGHDPNGR